MLPRASASRCEYQIGGVSSIFEIFGGNFEQSIYNMWHCRARVCVRQISLTDNKKPLARTFFSFFFCPL
jgi:hypothetical protein